MNMLQNNPKRKFYTFSPTIVYHEEMRAKIPQTLELGVIPRVSGKLDHSSPFSSPVDFGHHTKLAQLQRAAIAEMLMFNARSISTLIHARREWYEARGRSRDPTEHHQLGSNANETASILMDLKDEKRKFGDRISFHDMNPAKPIAKKRRGNLPKSATSVLKHWLFEHTNHPYPSEEEKRLLAEQNRLTLNQISNWFINARRRILNPLLVRGRTLSSSSEDDEDIVEIMPQNLS